MKICIHCQEEKELADLVKDKRQADGRTSLCKKCANIKNRLWDKNNPEKSKASRKNWVEKNPERVKANNRKSNAANKEKVSARCARWRKANPEKYRQVVKASQVKHRPYRAALQGARKAAKLRATPAWANEFFIEEAYDLAARRTKVFGFDWQVDHIVPLKSKLVCGLHVHDNLAVIPAVLNIQKGNRVWPDMPSVN